MASPEAPIKIKSPLVGDPDAPQVFGAPSYDSVTYSVHLSSGAIVTRPSGFPVEREEPQTEPWPPRDRQQG